MLPVAWYDQLARILTLVEDSAVWPDGLLDAYIAMIPKSDGDATPLGKRPFLLFIVFGFLLVWFKCVSKDRNLLLNAARFTTGYVRLVGQEPAPNKCVLMSTFRIVRNDMRRWIVTDEGDKWSVKLDVRDLGGHLDTTFREWLCGFSCLGSSGHFSSGSDFCSPSGVSWSDTGCQVHVSACCSSWD